MIIGLSQSGDAPPGVARTPQRFKELITEAVLADEAGFDFYALNEQHFVRDIGISSSEVVLGFLAALTSRIRLRFASVVLLAFNHPIRVAERLATLDVLSDGRAELGTARSNNRETLDAFGVLPDETRAQWRESLEVVAKALTQDPFEHKGRFWNIPKVSLTPRPIQSPHPPLFVAATQLDTHRIAGELGIGVMTGNTLPGWDYVADCIRTYREAAAAARPISGYANNCQLVNSPISYIAETQEQAMEEARPAVLRFVQFQLDLFRKLAPSSRDYAYMGDVDEVEKHKGDLEYLINAAPYINVGTPEFFVERFRHLEKMGVDQVAIRFDGMGHEKHRKAIAMMGKYVIPEFKSEKVPMNAPKRLP